MIRDPYSSIANTLAKYAHCFDLGPIEEIGDCFTADAEADYADAGIKRGRAEIVAELVRRRQGDRYEGGATPWHVLTNMYVAEMTTRDAKVYTRWTLFRLPPNASPHLLMAGYYTDEFREEGGVWRIRRRIGVRL